MKPVDFRLVLRLTRAGFAVGAEDATKAGKVQRVELTRGARYEIKCSDVIIILTGPLGHISVAFGLKRSGDTKLNSFHSERKDELRSDSGLRFPYTQKGGRRRPLELARTPRSDLDRTV